MQSSIGRSTFERALAATLAAQIAMAPGLAAAAGSPTAAQLRSRGDAAMDDGAFASAIEVYRASYELSRDPALLYNVGNAYEHLGDYPDALTYLERFAVTAGPELKARVPRLDDLLESLRARLAVLVVRCSLAGARVIVGGAVKGTTPLAADIIALPGTARVEIVADGYRPFVRELSLVAGKEARIDATLAPTLALRAAPPPSTRDEAPPAPGARAKHAGGDDSIAGKWWLWTGAGVVVGSVIVVAILASSPSTARPGWSNGAAPAPAQAGRVGAPLVTW
jgi:hypothetical protein